MDPKLHQAEHTSAISDDQIDDLLGELDLADASEDIIEEPVIEELDEDGEALGLKELDEEGEDAPEVIDELAELNEEESRELEVSLMVAEVISETATPSPAIDLDPAKTPSPAPKEKKTRATKAAAPKVERDLAALPREAFVLLTSQNDDDHFDLDANKTAVLALRPTQKKVADKFDNLFVAVNAGRDPSVYVTACLKTLVAKGTVTTNDLVTALTESKYTIGTARSQAGQVMALFATLKIGMRSGQTLTLNPDSLLVEKLTKTA